VSGRVLIVTNDFPPRQGGIETFVATIADGLADRVVVYTSRTPGEEEADAARPYPVVRDHSRVLLPTPPTRATMQRLMRQHGCDRVLFGAAAPLGLLGGAARRGGATRVVGMTHGHELWWARLPPSRLLLRRIARLCDALTYLAEYTRLAIAEAVGPDAAQLVRMPPGVDSTAFVPAYAEVRQRERARWGIADDVPVVLCLSRLTPRKGQDTLIRALPEVRRRVPGTVALIVGDGPARDRLERLVGEVGLSPDAVVFTGGVAHEQTPAFYATADAFAMICRDRRRGLEVEGLGIVFLEAQAAGLPVVVGRSGGAVDTVRDGVTGFVVEPLDPGAVATALVDLLGDPDRARAMGAAGRAWVTENWGWDRVHATIRDLLALD
jgi:phosphatidylinositol alpha-1,6-mannosyltransferase